MDAIRSLPPVSALSSSVLSVLNDELRADTDLSRAAILVSELQNQCSELDRNLIGLNSRLESSLAAYASFTDRIGTVVVDVNSKLTDLCSSTRVPTSITDGTRVGRTEHALGEELPALAKEVARVETVRAYAETALKLDNLVGEIEDAVSSTMNKTLRKYSSSQNSEEVRQHAIRILKMTEDLLSQVTKTRPQWARLVLAVDHRVDRALAILRPQAIADHRALLTSLGWPPPLSNLTSSNLEKRKPTEVQNSLLTMEGNLKNQYCENFISLCSLQMLQRQRKSRQLEGHFGEILLNQPLWAIEELVNPLTVASQRHFSKWNDKPEFIFALMYKITRDFVDSMDELLQPLVDDAKLTGYSCREDWVSAMVNALSVYLAKEIFPIYIGQLEEESDPSIKSQARVSWLHLVDLMISFDKRIRSLVSQSGILSLQEDGNLIRISSLSVFCDRPDWLDLWADIELNDSLGKLKPEMDEERNWTMKVQAELLSSSEDYRTPVVSGIVLQQLSYVIDRCRSLPTVSLRARFLRLAGLPMIQMFLDHLVLRCQEAEGLTALTDDNDLIKVVNSINAAHYFESVVKELCEDVFFLEMGMCKEDEPGVQTVGNAGDDMSVTDPSHSVFKDDVENLEKFRFEWINKLSVVVSRGFDARSRDYIKNRKQWQENWENQGNVSKTLVNALDYLQGTTSVIEGTLNQRDFVGFWRNLAAALDRLLFNSIFTANVKFSDGGVHRLRADMEVLYGVFERWCLRPEGFFPRLSEASKLLKLEEKQIQESITGGSERMKEYGFRHLSVAEAEKIAKCRVFSH